jgi:hypothetical protein
MLSAVKQLVKNYQGVRRQTSTQAPKSNSYNIYYLYMFRKGVLANQTDQTKQNSRLIRELAGDIIGCVSLMVLFFVTLFIAGVYQ